MVYYSTNWMGPINSQWIKEHGEGWSAGRIDIFGLDATSAEMSLPPLRTEDWNMFSAWLDTIKTDSTYTLPQLVELYEKTNPKITWLRG